MPTASPFEILPAIDLQGGRVVRLRQGDFEQETAYSEDPVGVARAFVEAGANWIHLVDLDGARAGRPVQQATTGAVIDAVGTQARVEVAGGLRDADVASAVLASGAARIVLGTAALADPAMVGSLVTAHGAARIVVAIDVRDGRALGHGWARGAPGPLATDAIAALADSGVTTFQVTAIERDGLLGGPDLRLYERVVGLGRGAIIASGGVASLADLQDVQSLGCAGAILGRALYEGRLDLAEALRYATRNIQS